MPMMQDEKKNERLRSQDAIQDDKNIPPLFFIPSFLASKLWFSGNARIEESLEIAACLTRRRELPGLIKTEFTRAPEKPAHAEIATSQVSVVNPVHNWRNNYTNMESHCSTTVLLLLVTTGSPLLSRWRENDDVTGDPDENLIFDVSFLAAVSSFLVGRLRRHRDGKNIKLG